MKDLDEIALQLKALSDSLRDIAESMAAEEAKPEGRISAQEIIANVADTFSLSVGELTSKRKFVRIVKMRAVAYTLLRKYTDIGILEIGEKFQRHHTSVIYGIEELPRS
jgi:chromosomal replication initiator protein